MPAGDEDPPYYPYTTTPSSYSQYNYSTSSQYGPPRQLQYSHLSTLKPLSNYGASPMSRGPCTDSNSSSNSTSSDSTPGSSLSDYPDPPSPEIEVAYATVASSKHRQSKPLKPISVSQSSQSRSNNRLAEYPCLYPGCSYIGRPFDLDRHMKKHYPPSPEEKHDCPDKGCGRVGVHGFDRKDHVIEHLRNYHMWDIYPRSAGRGKSGKSGGEKKHGLSGDLAKPPRSMEESRSQALTTIPESFDNLHRRSEGSEAGEADGADGTTYSAQMVYAEERSLRGTPDGASGRAYLPEAVQQCDTDSQTLENDLKRQNNVGVGHMINILGLSIGMRIGFWPGCSIRFQVEPPLEKGKQRIRWKCRCGRRLYDDFLEIRPGSVQELERTLKKRNSTHPSSSSEQTSRQQSETKSLINKISSTAKSFWNGELPKREKSPSLPTDRFNSSHQDPGNQSSVAAETLYLMLCIPYRRQAMKLFHMDVSRLLSDRSLFTTLKTDYDRNRGSRISMFALRRLRSIRFVQFEAYKGDLADIRKVDDIPPASRKDEYSYHPMPADFIPPVGENLMTHWYQYPEEAADIAICMRKVPKKMRERLQICPQSGTGIGWGIDFVEGLDHMKLWILGLIGLLASIIFGVCWSILKDDIQGGFSISVCVMAILTFTTGTLQAAWEPQ